MPLDPRTPVLVGVGQWSNRVDQGEAAAAGGDQSGERMTMNWFRTESRCHDNIMATHPRHDL